jgi:hypothetical protein
MKFAKSASELLGTEPRSCRRGTGVVKYYRKMKKNGVSACVRGRRGRVEDYWVIGLLGEGDKINGKG